VIIYENHINFEVIIKTNQIIYHHNHTEKILKDRKQWKKISRRGQINNNQVSPRNNRKAIKSKVVNLRIRRRS